MSRGERLLFAAILGLGAFLRIWGLTFGLPHPEARPDETIVVITALGLLFAGLNPKFFIWPSLEFYTVAALYRVGWEIGHLRGLYQLKFDMFKAAAVHISPYVMVPRALAVLAALITIWLVFRLADRLTDRATALTAAFFVATAFVHVRDSHFGVTDVPMTAMVVAAVLSLTRVVDDPTRMRRWVVSGVLCGLAASTKYNGGLVLAAALATAAVILGQSTPDRRKQILRGAAALVAATLVAFLCTSPYVLIDWPHFSEAMRFDFEVLDRGHGMSLDIGWLHHLRFSLWYGLGPALLVAGLLGIPLLTAKAWRDAVVLCTFPLLFFLVVGRGHSVFLRYIVPVVPFLCITGAFALVWTVRRFASAATAPKIIALAAVAMAIPSLARAIAFDHLISQTDTRVLAQEWIANHVQPDEQVGQIPPVLIYPDFGVAKPANLVTFDINQKAFISGTGGKIAPAWIVVPTSPLQVYTVAPEELTTVVTAEYTREITIPATRGPEPAEWFDQQDLFFMPFSTFSMRERPGPEIQIYRRQSSVVSP
jgi:hypothetical protein